LGFLGIFRGSAVRLTFRDCEVDFGTREAFRNRRGVHLSPKAFQLLELLAARRPEAVPKAMIHERVWPGSFVSEATVASVVAEIRSALGDTDRGAPLVRTVHGFGYAFSAEARETEGPAPEEPSPEWRVVWGDNEVALLPGENLVGRDHRCAIRLDLESVSRRHSRIALSREGASLEDLQSKNGTFLNGLRVDAARALSDGDEIRVGAARLRVRRRPLSATTKTEAI
jgi:DNA-binding winged helix-turn-helix (wHTH) protein